MVEELVKVRVDLIVKMEDLVEEATMVQSWVSLFKHHKMLHMLHLQDLINMDFLEDILQDQLVVVAAAQQKLEILMVRGLVVMEFNFLRLMVHYYLQLLLS